MPESIVRLPTVTRDGATTTRAGVLEHPSTEPVRVTFTHAADADLAVDAIRPFLLAFLLPAMRIGDPLVVDGELDEGTLQGLLEWQGAMARWHPGQLTVVPIRAEVRRIDPQPTVGSRALLAFSGGLDSAFSAVRHRPGAPDPGPDRTARRASVATGLMVHGFDIPLDQPNTFRSAYDGSARMLSSLGITSRWLRTDVRALEPAFGISWETQAHGIWLVAALACLEPGHDLAIVPSSFPYDLQQLPWGSNPMTDHLLGSTSVPVWHDGSGTDRPTKAQTIARFAGVAAGVRVCWQGEHLDRNCGHCSKCLATQASFWAVGVEAPASFPDRGTPAELVGMDLHHLHQRLLARSIQDHAAEVGRTDVVEALDEALSRW